jgi:hypothetical protein
LTATIKGIGALDYRLYRFDGDPQRYLLQRSDHEQMFLLGETTAEGLIESVRLVDKGSSGA